MALIEVPFGGSEFLFNYKVLETDKYHTAPFMTTAWQKSLKYFEKYNKFADHLQPQYFVLKQFKDHVTMQIAVPDDGFDGAFLYIEKCDGTRIEIAVLPDVVIVPGEVNREGQQLRRLTWQFFLDDWITTVGHYCWYVRVDYVDSFEELAGLPMDIQIKHPNTVLIEYTHSTNEFDIWFEGYVFSYRINANNQYGFDKVELLNFMNQKANQRLLYARSWAIWNFEIGFPGEGINNWDQKKMYQIFKFDEVYIDGVRFLMEADAEFEPTDYGNRYPLKKLKINLVEYDQSDSVTVGSAGIIEVMRLSLDGYPYLIDKLTLFGFGSPGDPVPDFMLSHAATNYQVEVLNVSEQNDFLDQLDIDAVAFRMTGNFYEDGGILYYQRGPGENYVPYLVSRMNTAHEVSYTTIVGETNINILINQTGKTSISVRTSAGVPYFPPVLSSGDFSTNINVPAPDYGDYIMRIYCNDLMTLLNIVGTGTNIKGLGGKVSPMLNWYLVNNGDIPVLGFGFLLNAKLNIQYLFLDLMGITEIDNTDFDTTGDFGRWQKLKRIAIRGNKLNATYQDKFYVDYYQIALVYHGLPPFIAGLDTRFQSPPSAPTTLGSGAFRSVLTLWGYPITF